MRISRSAICLLAHDQAQAPANLFNQPQEPRRIAPEILGPQFVPLSARTLRDIGESDSILFQKGPMT